MFVSQLRPQHSALSRLREGMLVLTVVWVNSDDRPSAFVLLSNFGVMQQSLTSRRRRLLHLLDSQVWVALYLVKEDRTRMTVLSA